MHEEPAPQAHPPAKNYTSLIASALIALCLVGGALYWRHVAAQNNTASSKVFTATELAKFNGQNGQLCYVAVDDTVYEIEQGRLWNNGKHDSSEGKASCGRDLTDVISQSPHGRSKLSALKKVGTLH